MASTNESDLNVGAIENFIEYLQIPSVHPDVNYDGCLQFLTKQAQSLGLPMQVHYCFPKKPIITITWKGYEPNSPSILLSSHMDVVPAYEEKWKYKPFSGHVTKEGNIYGRGAQDMKCVGVQYLEAVRRLRLNEVTLRRTVHLLFTPDEEIGGAQGMREFVKTPEFKRLNVGFALDEGMASPSDEFVLFHGERCIWYIIVHCMGQPGHGSLLLKNTAGQKLQYLLNKVYEFRAQQEKRLESDSSLTIGDVMSINVTQIQGGVQPNVIPPEFTLVLDCRIPVTTDVVQWEETLQGWCKAAGENVWIEYKQKLPQIPATKLDHSNPFWIAFRTASEKMGLKVKTEIFTGGTDSRYLRQVGIPALGFSPMNNTPILLHDHNEYLNQNVFLRGIEIYCQIIQAVSNVPDITG
ncbi:hypothetical protein PPYR_14688 [Photinus pyralis]|uniref:N-acyl-aliphatic-L-amino acid amidohydrolase n=1 Tax=Photinus pyralis TaxID=7054 RepID=A0A5N4A636_PHOPY|nr:aminoacylase-1-like [Photinus pyralis]KAB0792729.1 hypothetical protein PPYR_14688 [Photinus pyralis]